MNPPPSGLEGRLRAHLARREPSSIELLERMVAINSFTRNVAGIEELALLTAEAFAGLGFRAEQVADGKPGFGRHLVLTRPATRPGAPMIGLVSHLDTVFSPEEEEAHDFRWREEGDRLYGPGTVDIKGGTVVAYMMLDALLAEAPEVADEVEWVVLLDCAEEQGPADFQALCLERLPADRTLACLVLEGGIWVDRTAQVVVARKGIAVFRVEVSGRASHAGSGHEHGASAVAQLADVVRKLEDLTDYDRQLTVNVGSVGGGTVHNRVPHKAWAQCEMRAFSQEVYDQALAEVRTLDDFSSVASAADGHPCRVKVIVELEYPPWPPCPPTQRLLEVWQEAAESLGLRVEPETRGGLSDANLLWQGLPTLDGLGPAGANAHCSERTEDGSKDQEYAVRSSFVPKALLNLTAILRLLARSGPD